MIIILPKDIDLDLWEGILVEAIPEFCINIRERLVARIEHFKMMRELRNPKGFLLYVFEESVGGTIEWDYWKPDILEEHVSSNKDGLIIHLHEGIL